MVILEWRYICIYIYIYISIYTHIHIQSLNNSIGRNEVGILLILKMNKLNYLDLMKEIEA